MPDEIVDVMLDVCQQKCRFVPGFLPAEDPLVGHGSTAGATTCMHQWLGAEKRYDFDAATRIVMDAFGRFSPEMADMARRVYLTEHMDSEVRKGKTGAALFAGV